MPIDDINPSGTAAHTSADVDYEELAPAWHDVQKYNPATRHRRRLMLKLMKPLQFESVLEIGCGQPYFPQEIQKSKSITYTGTDVSRTLIDQNRKEFPLFQFDVLDIVTSTLPKQYDLIIATECIEHVSDYKKALANIAQMAKKYVLITVPSCRVFPIDRMIGHYRHYNPEDITGPLEALGFRTSTVFKWGFPFHNLYKHLINSVASPEAMRNTFSISEYTGIKKIISVLLYWLFFLNMNRWGYQLIVLAERKNSTPTA